MTLDGVGVRDGVWLRARGILLFVPPVRSLRENCRNSRDFVQPTGKGEFHVRRHSYGPRKDWNGRRAGKAPQPSGASGRPVLSECLRHVFGVTAGPENPDHHLECRMR